MVTTPAYHATRASLDKGRVYVSPRLGDVFSMILALRRHVISGCVLLGLSLASAQTQKELSVVDIVKRSSDAVVQIVTSVSLGKEMALGSGFIVSADGRVVTNYHVIKGAHSAVVRVSNGAFFRSTVFWPRTRSGTWQS